jgi:DNA polymerase-3 subunit beta
VKVKIEKEDLSKATQTIQNVVSLKNILPILTNILIEAEGKNVKLTATDLEMAICYTIPAEVYQSGAITVPAKKFSEMVKELPSAPTTLSTLKNNTMSINSENTFFKLLGLPKDDFPKIPQITESDKLEIEQQTLKDMLAMTVFATSHDEVRYILNGMLFVVKNQTLRLVATDGRRLAMIERQVQTTKDLHKHVIIPNKAVGELNRILQDEGNAKMVFTENQVMFRTDDVVLITRVIEGEYPNYEQVIPKEAANKIKVNTTRFLMGTRRAALMTHQDSQSIRIDLLKDKMIISKNSPDLGEVKDQVEVVYAGKEMSVGFNPHYLADALKNISQEEVNFEIEGPDKAGVIRTQGPADKYIYLVLPMQLS